MGLMDILNGMQNGPRGQSQPSSPGTSSGGLSPMMMALLGVLAFKAMKSLTGGQPAGAGAGGQAAPRPGGGSITAGNPGTGLGDILGGLFGGGAGSAAGSPAQGKAGGSLNIPGGLGSLLGGGAAAGGLLSGGLGNLIKDLEDSGQRTAAQSWIGSGPNKEIAPKDLEAALGGDTIDALSKHTGMGRANLLAGLSQNLPALVDQLTPEGRLPTAEEASRMV